MRDSGLLPDDSVARRIDREMFVLIGGTAALLLQVAHPLVAAGVDQHSDFRRAPHGRLLRTLNTTLAAVFSERRSALGALAAINRRHASVRGVSRRGEPYDARDPSLLLWVQCTLVLTSLRVFELVCGRLANSDRQRYWEEALLIAESLGLPAKVAPKTISDLERYERTMLEQTVIPDGTSRAVARDVLRPYRAIPDALWWPIDALTAGLLPAGLRRAFGLSFGAPERLFFRAVISGLRLSVPLVPAPLRIVPQARRWEERRKADLADRPDLPVG